MMPILEHPVEHPVEHAELLRSSAFGGLELLRAHFVKHAFVPHSHAEYTVGLVTAGGQQFRYRGTRHLTPSSGFFVLHPQEAHTGAASGEDGFSYRAFYPSPELMHSALERTRQTGRELPYFRKVVQNDVRLSRTLESLLEDLPLLGALEAETRTLGWLAHLLEKGGFGARPEAGREPLAVREARAFLETHPERPVSLLELSGRVGLSPFYFARAFSRAVGMPPHSYHEGVRVRRAKALLEGGMPLEEVAFLSGFAHQSHFSERFRRHVGLPPGRYQEVVSHRGRQQSKMAQDTPGSSG